MFDSLVVVKIIELQNDAQLQHWRNDEDAFYRDLGSVFGRSPFSVWRRILGATAQRHEKTDRQSPTGPLFNACRDICDHAAR